jgi:hypothetical protein
VQQMRFGLGRQSTTQSICKRSVSIFTRDSLKIEGQTHD